MTAHAISSTAADWPLKPERCRASISVVGDTAHIDFPSRGWRSADALFLLIAGPALASLFVAVGVTAITTASTRKDFGSGMFLVAFGLIACVIALREARRLAITAARVIVAPDRLSLFERTLRGERREDLPRGDVTWVDQSERVHRFTLRTIQALRVHSRDSSRIEFFRDLHGEDRAWLVMVLRRALNLTAQSSSNRIAPSRAGSIPELPSTIRRNALIDGARYTLDPIDDTDARRVERSHLRMGVFMMALPPLGLSVAAWLNAAGRLPIPAPVIIMAGSMLSFSVVFGLYNFMTASRKLGRGPRLEITGERLRVSPPVGILTRWESRPLDRLRRLELLFEPEGPAPDPTSLTDGPALLRAGFDEAPPLLLAPGYPRSHLDVLARRLVRDARDARRLAAPDSAAGPAIEIVWRALDNSDTELHSDPAPPGNAFRRRTPDGWRVEFPSQTHGRGDAVLALAAWLLMLAGLVGWGLAAGMNLAPALFGPGMALALGAVGTLQAASNRLTVGRRTVRLTLAPDSLSAVTRGGFVWWRQREERWQGRDIITVQHVDSGRRDEMRHRPIMVLRLLLIDGTQADLLSDRPEAEQRWVLQWLRTELGLSARSQQHDQASSPTRVSVVERHGQTASPQPFELPHLPARTFIEAQVTSDGFRISLQMPSSPWVFAFGLMFVGFMLGAPLIGLLMWPWNWSRGLLAIAGLIVAVAIATFGFIAGFVALLRESATVTAAGDLLTITQGIGQNLKNYHWLREQVADVQPDRDPKRDLQPGSVVGSRRPFVHRHPARLRVTTHDRRTDHVLRGWPEGDVAWIAAVIRRWRG